MQAVVHWALHGAQSTLTVMSLKGIRPALETTSPPARKVNVRSQLFQGQVTGSAAREDLAAAWALSGGAADFGQALFAEVMALLTLEDAPGEGLVADGTVPCVSRDGSLPS
mmetsp:Transcript_34981/g.63031  ORF Transcript_34981/g.63031 Transcript_34981/m.63031 type:complete len:111 (+) Transcript_34981:394-726(+)